MFALTSTPRDGENGWKTAVLVGDNAGQSIFHYVDCPVCTEAFNLVREAVQKEYVKPVKMTADEWWSILAHRIKIDFILLTDISLVGKCW